MVHVLEHLWGSEFIPSIMKNLVWIYSIKKKDGIIYNSNNKVFDHGQVKLIKMLTIHQLMTLF
jgi:hypothetical protein